MKNEIWLHDKDFRKILVIESYTSFIWTDRFNEYGDFSITFKMDRTLLDTYKAGYYITTTFSDRMMIVEDFELITDVESGDDLTITGRSLEGLLCRRIIWNQTIFNGNLQNAIEKLLNDAIINPSIADRKISNFVFRRTDNEYINSITIDTQYTGDNLYDVISDLCKESNIGFKVIFEDGFFVFSLFVGEDNTADVIFSPEFGNLQSSDYKEMNSEYKNVALVAGEGEGNARKTTTIGESSGLDRKELYVDARDLSTNNGAIALATYYEQLKQRGNEKLAENQKIHSHYGDIIPNVYKSYGIDYHIGDFVSFIDSYGFKSNPRVDE